MSLQATSADDSLQSTAPAVESCARPVAVTNALVADAFRPRMQPVLSSDDLVPFVAAGFKAELHREAREREKSAQSAQPQPPETDVRDAVDTLERSAAQVTADSDRSQSMMVVNAHAMAVGTQAVTGRIAAFSEPIRHLNRDAVEVEESQPVKTVWPAKYDVLGVELSHTSYDELVPLIIRAAKAHEPTVATFLPVHGVVTAALDKAYRYRVNAFDIIGADGQPVKWALNLLHRLKMPDRVCGPVTMIRLCQAAAREGVSIYLYGSTQQTLDLLHTRLTAECPGLKIVGLESPPFRPLSIDENQAAVDRINSSGAGLVFIGLGCPRQDVFAYDNRNKINAVQLCVGAAFDFHAGNKKMAPAWMQRVGLEWTYRLMQEPRRLWKRYLFTNSAFVMLMARRLLLGR